MILMPQIFDVTANENARYKRNELEYVFDMFGLAVVFSHNSCQGNTKMACNLDPRSNLAGQGHSLYMVNANI